MNFVFFDFWRWPPCTFGLFPLFVTSFNSEASLRDVTDTVQTVPLPITTSSREMLCARVVYEWTVQDRDSQCTVHMYTQPPKRQPPTSRSLSTLVLFQIGLYLKVQFGSDSTKSSVTFLVLVRGIFYII